MKVCIIGSGDAGIAAAARIRRLDREAQIDAFSKRAEIGGPPCEMPLVLSGVIPSWDNHFSSIRNLPFYQKRNIDIHLNTEVTGILRQEKRIIAGGEKYGYDKAILAMGAIPSIPPILGLDGKNEFTLSTDIADGRALGKVISKYNSAAIVGGGFIALEIADALRARGYSKVYVVVRSEILRRYLDKDMTTEIGKVIRQNGVELILPAKIEGIRSKGEKKRIILSDREIEVDFVFFATGTKPNVELARKAGLTLGETGAIAVNEYLQTSDQNIYAVGDCMESWDLIMGFKRQHQLATSAIRTGYIAGRNLVLGNRLAYEGTDMPFVTKIFGYQIGAVGFTEREAREKGLDVVSVRVNTPWLREKFDGKPAQYKLIADRKTKKLIGSQITSEEIVSGTIDKLAVAIAARMPLVKLLQIDSCYSPHVQEDQLAVPIQRLIDALG